MGFTRQPLAETIAAITADVKSIYGSDIDVSSSTPDGQLIGIIAESASNAALALEEVNAAFDVRNARGTALSGRMRLNGLERKSGTYSTATFTTTGTAGVTIPTGSQLAIDGNVFATTADATCGNVITATCTAVGANVVSGGSSIRILTPIYGWQSVAFNAMVTTGSPYEADSVAQARRAVTVALPSQGMLDSIRARVLAVDNVTQCCVFENTTDSSTTIGSTTLTPHAVLVIAQGGVDADVANAIYLAKPLGCGLCGTSSQTIVDSQGNNNTIAFSRPATYPAYPVTPPYALITAHIRAASGYPGSTTAIANAKTAITSYFTALQIGEPINVLAIAAAIAATPGVRVESVSVSVDGGSTYITTGEASVPSDAIGYIIPAASIAVTVV